MASSNRQQGTENLPASIEGMIARLAGLKQCQADMSEVGAENTQLAALYQDDADAVCDALGVKWTHDNKYPTVALDAIAQLQAELARTRAELDAAEAALAASDIGGIYAEFDSLPDAITQMAESIKELEDRMGDVVAERQLRKEAERCARVARTLVQNRSIRLEQAEHHTRSAERRTELAEAKLERGHRTLTALGVPLDDENGKLPLTGRIERMAQTLFPERLSRKEAEQRAERAEALAALVSHETATLLVQLASNTQPLAGRADRNERAIVKLWRRDAEEARALAARIREALNEH